ncbi:MAG: SDR family oxidoreductase [Proteobacteria bacterium]|nr:SDR family oxidoreductase [Pseudomonadota bacterium]
MKKTFESKTAVVTGGTRGIGRAISLNLAREGARVFCLYARNRKSADEILEIAAAEKLSIECIKGDLSKEESLQSVLNEINTKSDLIDIVIHSAASGVHRPITELSDRHMHWTFDINVFAIHNLIRELSPKMPSGSRIVGVTSSGGTRVIPFYAAVGSSKGALESLFRHYASELAPKGISVNLVCPGLVMTDAVEAFPDKETRLQKVLDATPTAHITTPEDVAHLVNFLCHPLSKQIVGQTIVIDGGKTLSS